VIRGYFDRDFRPDGPFDAVVHSHVLEHQYEPREFLAQLARLVPEGGLHLFSGPDMEAQLRARFTNCLNFEHTVYLPEATVEYLLAQAGFRVVRKRRFLEHSLFYATVRDSTVSRPAPPARYDAHRALFLDYVEHHRAQVAELNARLARVDGPVYLFGAHVFSQALLAFGLRESAITAVLDNSLAKIGRRLYGTGLAVRSPRDLAGAGRVRIILKAGAYSAEIKADILENINAQAEFWE
jgi:hypothetical protein